MKKFLLFFCICFLFSCEKEDDHLSDEMNVELSEFTDFEEDETRFHPNFELPEDVSFLAGAIKTSNEELLISSIFGDCGASEVESCFQLESLDPQSGFGNCKSGYGLGCYNFLIVIRDGETQVISELSEFINLVGDIDTAKELSFIIRSEDFFGESYKKVDGGYEVIATKLIEICEPIISHKYHLMVSHSGEIKILAEEENWRSDGCI